MKVSKYNFVKVLVKHIQLKLNNGVHQPYNESLAVASFLPIFNSYSHRLISSGIMDDLYRVDVEKLAEKSKELFTVTPTINIPVAGSVVTLTKKDADAFLKEVEKYGEVDQVIYLPCQN